MELLFNSCGACLSSAILCRLPQSPHEPRGQQAFELLSGGEQPDVSFSPQQRQFGYVTQFCFCLIRVSEGSEALTRNIGLLQNRVGAVRHSDRWFALPRQRLQIGTQAPAGGGSAKPRVKRCYAHSDS